MRQKNRTIKVEIIKTMKRDLKLRVINKMNIVMRAFSGSWRVGIMRPQKTRALILMECRNQNLISKQELIKIKIHTQTKNKVNRIRINIELKRKVKSVRFGTLRIILIEVLRV